MTITEIYEHDCPYYMAIGMTYDEYWYGDPLMVRAFYKANRLREEQKDAEAWLAGSYVLKALDAVVGNLFRDKGSQRAEYPTEPVLAQAKREKREKTEREQEQEALWAKAWMSQFVEAGKEWGKQ